MERQKQNEGRSVDIARGPLERKNSQRRKNSRHDNAKYIGMSVETGRVRKKANGSDAWKRKG